MPGDTETVQHVAAFFGAVLRRGLERLAAVPPGDPFWGGLPQPPSPHWANEYVRRRWLADPDDAEACWVLAALHVVHYCETDFGREYLEPLVARNSALVVWLVAAADYVFQTSGAPTRQLLRESLLRLAGRVPELGEQLRRGSRGDDPFLARMASAALAVIEGPAADDLPNQATP
jgi:hypothetical protein